MTLKVTQGHHKARYSISHNNITSVSGLSYTTSEILLGLIAVLRRCGLLLQT